MVVAAFDTLTLARNLREKAKLSQEQAEGFADAIAEALQGDMATKADLRDVEVSIRSEIREVKGDIREVEARLKADIRESELRLKVEIEGSKSDVIKWMFGAIGFQTLVVLGTPLAFARLFVR